ncbi:C45 family autoproteolytic acyltransferase/hydolase [Ottowia thiooxydans]|uniref:C45 family autoproteolytic acyltransferase/hydolase n=1 Tax=Ottowia thiooxydans TaxID=219182 RepID=UPI0003F8E914|nr:C45 family autoproteolytic acyltransferase/hydolase [Ottowia thiooxydans]
MPSLSFISWVALGQGLMTALLFTAATLWPVVPALGAEIAATQASIDPRTVQRWRTGLHEGWRYPQAGWTVVHIEGEPHERGLQHGHLMAAEISAYIHALSEYWSPRAPAAAWAQNRKVARQLFYRGFSQEQMQEMRGIAEGASAEGARVAGRRLDVLDIITLNASNEIDSVSDALAVTPHAPKLKVATQNTAIPFLRVTRTKKRPPQRCNAFLANGPATSDGQIVFGHITMYDLYPGSFYNVWMEIKPSTGYRFVMQTTPGGIHSSMDYSINEAGMLLAETTLDQGPMVPGGTSLAARIRQAQQYADSIDSATEMLTQGDNGLCSTEWLMGDLKRNEIALLTLGAGRSSLHRSSRQEWFEGAEGFYWSDNNTKDQATRLRATAHPDGRPSAAAVYTPSKRDAVWLQKYKEHKGRINLEFAREALTTPEIVSAYGIDAKFTDAGLASKLQTWASFGPPVGQLWLPTPKEVRDHSAIRPLIHNPWTLLDLQAPPVKPLVTAHDRPSAKPKPGVEAPDAAKNPQLAPAPRPVWQGTLLPASDADIWLSTAFAKFERILADTPREEAEKFGVELSYYRALHGLGARAGLDTPLAATRSGMSNTAWYQVATGKGVLFFNALREIVGAPAFDAAMRDFGQQHNGLPVSTQAFQSFLQTRTSHPLAPLFAWWTTQPGLPELVLTGAESRWTGQAWETVVSLDTHQLGPALSVPVTVETVSGSTTRSAVFQAANAQIQIVTSERPLKIVVDKHGTTSRGNGSPFTVLTLGSELERTLIVYGTQDEEAGNQEAARLLQTALRRREHNVKPAIRADRDLTEEELRNHHMLLIGRPATNAISQRLTAQWPMDFGIRSFQIRDELYAHPESALLVAGDNPLNKRFSVVLVAGLSSLGTYQAAGRFGDETLSYAPVLILPFDREIKERVLTPPELTRVPAFP